MIRLVIFDIGNVLLKFDHRITCRKLSAYSRYSPGQVYDVVFGGELIINYEQGKISSVNFFNIISKKLELNISFEQFYPIWCEIFSYMEGMEEIVRSLEGKVKLFILSNTDELHFGYIRNKYSIFEYFSSFILSYEIGARKPDKSIYRKALKLAQLTAEEALFIDDIYENVTPFLNMGGKGIVFRGADNLKNDFKKYKLM